MLGSIITFIILLGLLAGSVAAYLYTARIASRDSGKKSLLAADSDVNKDSEST